MHFQVCHGASYCGLLLAVLVLLQPAPRLSSQTGHGPECQILHALQGCGTVNRVTILTDRMGSPKVSLGSCPWMAERLADSNSNAPGYLMQFSWRNH